MKTTTLNTIWAYSPYAGTWGKLLNGLGKTQADDEPLAYAKILEICGLSDALLVTGSEPQYNWRLLAVAFARRVQHLNPDPRVSGCLDVAERYANGLATDEELSEARDAARTAADAAACFTAGETACFTVDAAWAAAWSAGENLDCETEWVAKAAALASTKAAGGPARAAWDAERKEQEKLFLEFVNQ